MQPRLSPKRNAAMTLFEVGVVIAIVVILAAVFFQGNHFNNHLKLAAQRIICINNLKQINLAYKIWEGDNGDIFPMGISITNGGSMEKVQSGKVAQTFLVMSNELSTPRILYCPADEDRVWTNTFSGLSACNISYFFGVDVTNDSNPRMILTGDCNFELGGVPVKPGLCSFQTNDPVAWQANRHINSGNIGLADGSVQSATSAGLQTYLQQTSFTRNRFAIP